MTRMTAKLREAQSTALQIGIDTNLERNALYDRLLKAGYNWDGKAQTWSQRNPWMGSAFEDARGNPTGHVKIRVMCHPDECDTMTKAIVAQLESSGRFRITEVSKQYPNRRGVGVRVYITGEMK
jgi:hypothetical protein